MVTVRGVYFKHDGYASFWLRLLVDLIDAVTAGVLCSVPVLVNTLRGLQSASPRQLELMRSYAAGEVEIWRRVRVPSALPYVFTALKVASVLAMIGAIVGEYFGGAFNALGVLIRSAAHAQPVTPDPFATASDDRLARGQRRAHLQSLGE